MNKQTLIGGAAIAAALIGAAAYAWSSHHAGIDVAVSRIEKVTEQADATSAGFCASFQMTPAQFHDYFKRARPVAESDRHDYVWFPCYYKTSADGKEYRIRLGGLAEVIERDGKTAAYHCADEGGRKCSEDFPFSAGRD